MKNETRVFINFPVSAWRGTLIWARNALFVFALFGVGIWANSHAMQWFAFMVLVLVAIDGAIKQQKYTPQEAADMLQEKFGVRAK